MEIILDTNVLVSGLLYPTRPIALVVDALFLTALQHERLIAVYDRRILEEYATVLARPHLASRFEQSKASAKHRDEDRGGGRPVCPCAEQPS